MVGFSDPRRTGERMIMRGGRGSLDMQTTTDSNVRDEQSSAAVPPSDTNLLLRHVRRVLVFLFGISVLLVGIAMIIGPGPAVVVIPLGLGILATEFLWARRILDSLKRRLADAHTVAAS